MTDLADILTNAVDLILYGCVGVMAVATGKFIFVDIPRHLKKLNYEIDELISSYSDNLGRNELVRMHNAVRPYFIGGTKKRHGELKDLLGKIESQLDPIIKDEITASLTTTKITRRTSLEDLSQTYKEISCTYHRIKGK